MGIGKRQSRAMAKLRAANSGGGISGLRSKTSVCLKDGLGF